ncbi:DJ-1/PfpI family protein [Mesorhizobium sp. M1380]|uniref:DJ-1/PfpI family protein n=1 Tax=Mesorhizobium sp. M1380 TaxID=2957093 RepID=UPI0033362E2F
MPARFAFVLAREFTLSPFSLFLDTLRLAGDEGDRSQRVQFDWQVVGNCGLPIRASCGVELMLTRPVGDPLEYDVVVVVGGLLNVPRALSDRQEAFVRLAAAKNVRIVGLCTGFLHLGRIRVARRLRCIGQLVSHSPVSGIVSQRARSCRLPLRT